jgi:hypothetical protein
LVGWRGARHSARTSNPDRARDHELLQATDLEGAEGSRAPGTCEHGTSREGHPRQAGPTRRSVPLERSIDIEIYDRHAEKLREELTLVSHSGQLDELDVEGILAFAERVLPRAADLWLQASLEQRQRFQQLFFPEGIAFDGNGFVGTAVTAPAFSYLRPIEGRNEGVVDLTGIEPVTS